MRNIEIIFPKKKLISEKQINSFINEKNQLLSLKVIEIVDTLNFLSEYWTSSKSKIKNNLVENSLGYVIPC